MPVTPWEAVAGHKCEECGGPATHIYGWSYLCCDCHTGEKDGGLYTQEEAKQHHERVLAAQQQGGGEGMITPEQLQEIEARAEVAGAGKEQYWAGSTEWWFSGTKDCVRRGERGVLVAAVYRFPQEPLAVFLASSFKDIPELCQALREAWQERDAARKQVEVLSGTFSGQLYELAFRSIRATAELERERNELRASSEALALKVAELEAQLVQHDVPDDSYVFDGSNQKGMG